MFGRLMVGEVVALANSAGERARDYDKQIKMEALPFVLTFVIIEDMFGLLVSVRMNFNR